MCGHKVPCEDRNSRCAGGARAECRRVQDRSAGQAGPPDAAVASPLSPKEQVVRVSMALRGMRPSPDDIAGWSMTPRPSVARRRVRSIRSLCGHYRRPVCRSAADALDRAPTSCKVERDDRLANLGSSQEVRDALSEEPLRIVGEVVRQDLPLTEIGIDWTVPRQVGAEIWARHDYDASVGGIQQVSFTDGRPSLRCNCCSATSQATTTTGGAPAY